MLPIASKSPISLWLNASLFIVSFTKKITQVIHEYVIVVKIQTTQKYLEKHECAPSPIWLFLLSLLSPDATVLNC